MTLKGMLGDAVQDFLAGRICTTTGDEEERRRRDAEEGLVDERTGLEKWRADRTMNWFLGDGEWRPIRWGAVEVETGLG